MSFCILRNVLVWSVIFLVGAATLRYLRYNYFEAPVGYTKLRVIQLKKAILDYREQGGELSELVEPIPRKDRILSAPEYDQLIHLLTAVRPNRKTLLNPALLESNGIFQDEWGNRFYVAIDFDGDGQIQGSICCRNMDIKTTVTVWSVGQDGKDGCIDGIDSASEDNVFSDPSF